MNTAPPLAPLSWRSSFRSGMLLRCAQASMILLVRVGVEASPCACYAVFDDIRLNIITATAARVDRAAVAYLKKGVPGDKS